MPQQPIQAIETARKLKLLVVIASFGRTQDRYLEHIVAEYRSMSYETDIVVTSNVVKPVPEGVELVVGLPTKDPWSLPWAHQKIMAERIDRYDLFIYSENDVLIQQKNIEAFLRVSEAMPDKELPGFLLYEKGPSGIIHYVGAYGHFHWDPSSVCQYGPYTFAFLSNEHSACYLLTREQLQCAIDTGRYLVPPFKDKYDMACTASTAPYRLGGFLKLICISHLEDFLVHHLPDKYTGPDFSVSNQYFEKQLNALFSIGREGVKPPSLIGTETKLPLAAYSKDYYEPVKPEVVSQIPASVRSVLSLGTGSGKTERWLQQKGRQVTAVPLDPVIGSCLEGSGIELIYGDMPMVLRKLEGRKFEGLLLSGILHLVPDPAETLREFAELLVPNGYMLLVTPNVVNLKNAYFKFIRKEGFEKLASYQNGGVQKISKRRIIRWFKQCNCKIKRLKWIATPRLEKITRFGPRLLGPLLGAEMIVLGKRGRN